MTEVCKLLVDSLVFQDNGVRIKKVCVILETRHRCDEAVTMVAVLLHYFETWPATGCMEQVIALSEGYG